MTITAPAQLSAKQGWIPPIVLASAMAILFVGLGCLGGSLAVKGDVIPGTPGVPAGLADADTVTEIFFAILMTNLPAATGLASGIVTVGSFSALSGLLLGIFLGATVTASVNTIGAGPLAESVISYALIEMVGLSLAAVAGFLPLAYAVVGKVRRNHGLLKCYRNGLLPAGILLGTSFALLLVGAAIESLVISGAAASGSS